MITSNTSLRSGFDCIIRPAPSAAGRTTPSQPGHHPHSMEFSEKRYKYTRGKAQKKSETLWILKQACILVMPNSIKVVNVQKLRKYMFGKPIYKKWYRTHDISIYICFPSKCQDTIKKNPSIHFISRSFICTSLIVHDTEHSGPEVAKR